MLRLVRVTHFIIFATITFLLGPGVGAAFGDWQADWDKTVAAARQEGEVAIYGGYNPRYRKFNAAFEKKFDIKVNFTPGGGAQHATRILSEQRAKKYLVDVVMGGGSTFLSYPLKALEPMPPLLVLPEVTDKSAWWQNKHHFFDNEQKYVITTMASVGGSRIAINTKLVNPDEIRSFKDLLNPKWKGKIVQFHRGDPAMAPTILFVYNTPSLGPRFLSRFYREMDITFTRNLRQGVNWLAQGKSLIYFGGTPNSIHQANKKGLPVNFLPHGLQEGEILSGGYCCLAVLTHNPHPNATKVFVNWVLSREGQTVWQKLPGRPSSSLRTDIAKDYLPKGMVPKKGRSYFHVHEAKNYNSKDLDAIREITKAALKKK